MQNRETTSKNGNVRGRGPNSRQKLFRRETSENNVRGKEQFKVANAPLSPNQTSVRGDSDILNNGNSSGGGFQKPHSLLPSQNGSRATRVQTAPKARVKSSNQTRSLVERSKDRIVTAPPAHSTANTSGFSYHGNRRVENPYIQYIAPRLSLALMPVLSNYNNYVQHSQYFYNSNLPPHYYYNSSESARQRPVSSPSDGSNYSQNTMPRVYRSQNNDKKLKKQKLIGVNGIKDDKKSDRRSRQESKHKWNRRRQGPNGVNPFLRKLSISENDSFDEQTAKLIAQLEQTEEDKQMRLCILKDIAQIFSPVLPSVEPQMYGSSLTNIAFKTSDLDVYLFCPNFEPDRNFIADEGKIIYTSRKFKNIIRVEKARVPVIKAKHVDTNVDVDISFTSAQAVRNSKLIKHLLDSDNRLRPLAMLISLWAKLNRISEENRFTSYSIGLLFIYFLQNITPPVLPPLKDILYSDDENNWPCLFNNKQLTNNNESNISELFFGFFKLYTSFHFEKFVISLYLGQTIPVDEFSNIEKLSDDYNVYKSKQSSGDRLFKINAYINVQDPIEHDINVCKFAHRRLLRLFRLSCERTLNSCLSFLPQNQWLPAIISYQPLELKCKNISEFVIKYLDTDTENWFDVFKNKIQEILKILLIHISEVDDESVDVKEIYTFIAEAYYNVFNKKNRKLLRPYFSNLITLNELTKGIAKNEKPTGSPIFKAEFKMSLMSNHGLIRITITDQLKKKGSIFSSWVKNFEINCSQLLKDPIECGKLKKNDNSKTDKEVKDKKKKANAKQGSITNEADFKSESSTNLLSILKLD